MSVSKMYTGTGPATASPKWVRLQTVLTEGFPTSSRLTDLMGNTRCHTAQQGPRGSDHTAQVPEP